MADSRNEAASYEPDLISTDKIPTVTTATASTSIPQKRNAFTQLKWSAPKPKQQKIHHSSHQTSAKPSTDPASSTGNRSFASGLLPYVLSPDNFPTTIVLRQTEHTVLIRDQYPKALVHLLLLPRDPAFYNLSPFEAFNNTSSNNEVYTDFLALMRSEAESALTLAASELSRLVSPYSKTCIEREKALDSPSENFVVSDELPGNKNLPPPRDFLNQFKIGIHAEPSMNTLHIHIISEDNHSPALKHKKHYNSFNSSFFVPLEDFPLSQDDERLQSEKQVDWIKGDMICWRCSRNFGNKFKELKSHLDDEYHEWRKI